MTEFMPESFEKTKADIIGSIQDMARIGQPAVDYIALELKSEDVHIRIAAIQAIADIADEHSLHYLTELLSDRDMTVRFAAAQALGNLGDEAAIEPLFALCRDENCFVRIAAREAVTKILKRNRV